MDGNPSWLLNTSLPSNQFNAPTQATAFGSSSLAACSSNYNIYDDGKQDYQIKKMTNGNRHKNNLNLIGQDKSSLGLENLTREGDVYFTKVNPRALTVPYVYFENRDSLLKPSY